MQSVIFQSQNMPSDFFRYQYVILLLVAILVNGYANNTRNKVLLYLLLMAFATATSMMFSDFMNENKPIYYGLRILFSPVYYGPVLYIYLLSVYKTDITLKLVARHFWFPFFITISLYVLIANFSSVHPSALFITVVGDFIPYLYVFLGYRLIKDRENNSTYVAKRRFVTFYLSVNTYVLITSLISTVSLLFFTGIEPLVSLAMSFPKFYFENIMHPLWVLFCLILSLYTISEAWWVKKFIVKDSLVFNKIVSNNELNKYFAVIERDIETQKCYLKSNLNIKEYSRIIDVDIAILNAYVAHKKAKNFTNLLNHFRIEEFKRKVSEEASLNYTLSGIATECGFKSKSTFFRIFKDFENMTPKAFVDSIRSNSHSSP